MPYHKWYLVGGLATVFLMSIASWLVDNPLFWGVWVAMAIIAIFVGPLNNYGFEWYGGSKALPEWHPPSKSGAFGAGYDIGLVMWFFGWLLG